MSGCVERDEMMRMRMKSGWVHPMEMMLGDESDIGVEGNGAAR